MGVQSNSQNPSHKNQPSYRVKAQCFSSNATGKSREIGDVNVQMFNARFKHHLLLNIPKQVETS
jgi:hypothetical protein